MWKIGVGCCVTGLLTLTITCACIFSSPFYRARLLSIRELRALNGTASVMYFEEAVNHVVQRVPVLHLALLK
ncbi:hypothetical protein OUZ56_022616 [Daphnia magna]|uniref:Uncharacterized protein n=1 Tax=Daphnia magna TaxID=35525 RepID=A0ABR0AWX6_9CRUS|nr:hypothetical protein OUZ56_022616 [Daphnia magna]